MKSAEIKIGNAFRIVVDGKCYQNIITELLDGKVVVRAWPKSGGRLRGRWWLTYEHVKRDGELLYEAPGNKRGVGRC